MIVIDNILDVEKHLNGIEAVVFDLDDTLYSEKAYVQSGYKAVAALFPQVENMADELWEAFEQKKLAIDVVLEKHGLLAEKDRALHTYRFHQPDIRLYAGVTEMLLRIRKSRKIGIITDGRPEGQWAKLDVLGLNDMVDEIIVTDELGGVQFRKPNDTAFRVMAGRLQVPFEKMCYVGNNIAKDFTAPENLGMQSIWYQNRNGLYCAGGPTG